jgi:hypothetical protein
MLHVDMKLSTEYSGISFIIEVNKDEHYKELPTQLLDSEERTLLLSQDISYYEVIISSQNGKMTESYFYPGLLFSSEEEEMLEEINEFLIDAETLDEIVDMQKTAESASLLPTWAKK